MSVTAIVLTAGEYNRPWTGLDAVMVARSRITTAADLQRARFEAALAVRTSHFFYLDDDDDLPPDYLDVLAECDAADAPLVYTDELVRGSLRRAADYSQAAHLRRPTLVHHLALYETSAARAAIEMLPRGHYAPEFLLAWQVAKQGAAYVPRIGYHWNATDSGMHTWPCTSLSQARALVWCKGNP